MLEKIKKIFFAGAAILSAVFAYQQFYNAINSVLFRIAKYTLHPANWFIVILVFILLLSIVISQRITTGRFFFLVRHASYLSIVIVIYLAVVFILPKKQEQLTFFFVHDDTKTRIRPPQKLKISGLNIEEKKLNQLSKLTQLGEIKNDSILISTIERPKKSLENIFNFHGETPLILSMREVLEPISNKLIDISGTSFSKEIIDYISLLKTPPSRISILFERDYAIAEKELAESIKSLNIPVETVSIIFDSDSQGNNVIFQSPQTPDIDFVVYLGSYNGLKVIQAAKRNYNFIVPSWLRPDIKSIGRQSNSLVDTIGKACVVSSKFELIVNSDYATWHELLITIKNNLEKAESNLSIDLYEQFIALNKSTIKMSQQPEVVFF